MTILARLNQDKLIQDEKCSICNWCINREYLILGICQSSDIKKEEK
jgi:hypothetical protein